MRLPIYVIFVIDSPFSCPGIHGPYLSRSEANAAAKNMPGGGGDWKCDYPIAIVLQLCRIGDDAVLRIPEGYEADLKTAYNVLHHGDTD